MPEALGLKLFPRGAMGKHEVAWSRAESSERLRCIGAVATLVPRLQAAVRNYGSVTVYEFKKVEE